MVFTANEEQKMMDTQHRSCPCDFSIQRQYGNRSYAPYQMVTGNKGKMAGELLQLMCVSLMLPQAQKNDKQWQRNSQNLGSLSQVALLLHCGSVLYSCQCFYCFTALEVVPTGHCHFPLLHSLILTCLGLAWWAWLGWHCPCQSCLHGSLCARTVGSALLLIYMFDGSISAPYPIATSQREREKDWQYGRGTGIHSDPDSLLKRKREGEREERTHFHPEITPPSDDLSDIE